MKKLLETKNLSIVVAPKAKELLGERGYDPHFGARPLKRLITEIILNPLANKLLEGEFKPGDSVALDVDDRGEVTIRREGESKKKTARGG